MPISKELIAVSKLPWFPIMMKELGYEPVRHGRWRRGAVFTYLVTCSECGDVFDLTERTACWKYCSNCGAKMDNAGEVEDG